MAGRSVYGILKTGPNAGDLTECTAKDPATCRNHIMGSHTAPMTPVEAYSYAEKLYASRAGGKTTVKPLSKKRILMISMIMGVWYDSYDDRVIVISDGKGTGIANRPDATFRRTHQNVSSLEFGRLMAAGTVANEIDANGTVDPSTREEMVLAFSPRTGMMSAASC